MLNQCNAFVHLGGSLIISLFNAVIKATTDIYSTENEKEGSPMGRETAVIQDGCPGLHISTGTETSLTGTETIDNGDPHTEYYDL